MPHFLIIYVRDCFSKQMMIDMILPYNICQQTHTGTKCFMSRHVTTNCPCCSGWNVNT